MKTILTFLLIILFSRCNIDDKVHGESRTVAQSELNKVLISKVQYFRKAVIDIKNFPRIDDLNGWLEYKPRYLGEKFESVDKTKYNLILRIESHSLTMDEFYEHYGLYYDNTYLGKSYAGLILSLDEIRASKSITLEVRKFNVKNQINNYVVVGSIVIYFK